MKRNSVRARNECILHSPHCHGLSRCYCNWVTCIVLWGMGPAVINPELRMWRAGHAHTFAHAHSHTHKHTYTTNTYIHMHAHTYMTTPTHPLCSSAKMTDFYLWGSPDMNVTRACQEHTWGVWCPWGEALCDHSPVQSHASSPLPDDPQWGVAAQPSILREGEGRDGYKWRGREGRREHQLATFVCMALYHIIPLKWTFGGKTYE